MLELTAVLSETRQLAEPAFDEAPRTRRHLRIKRIDLTQDVGPKGKVNYSHDASHRRGLASWTDPDVKYQKRKFAVNR